MTQPNHDGARPAGTSEEYIGQLRTVVGDAHARFDALSKDYAHGAIEHQHYIDLSAKNHDLLTQAE